jgi:hypothetical protein
MSKTAHIERHFAWAKRYFGLQDFQVQGFVAVTRCVFQVYIVILAVALVATRYGRPDLITSRARVLAYTTKNR